MDAPIPTNRITELTDRQKDCLRLVLTGLGSKAIAMKLSIGPGTVDQHIKAATRTLGVSQRIVAAQMLAAAETASPPPQILDSQPARLEKPHEQRSLDVIGGEGRPLEEVRTDRVERAQAADEGRPAAIPIMGSPGLPIPTTERPINDLNAWQRLLWILVIAAGASLLALGLLNGAKGAIETLHGII